MDRIEFQKYWSYYLHLENMMINTFDYVALSKDNYETYSNQYASILQLTGAELDSFFKVFFEKKVAEAKKKKRNGKEPQFNIYNYSCWLMEKKSRCIDWPIEIYNFPEILKPFEKLDIQRHPEYKNKTTKEKLLWWNDFDEIKHHRQKRFKSANLKNCINILSALFIVECEKIYDMGANEKCAIQIPYPSSRLFSLGPNWSKQEYVGNGFMLLNK